MAETTLVLTPEEASLLLHLLESTLGETRVEAHHTRSQTYREEVKHEESLLRGLIEKLRQRKALN